MASQPIIRSQVATLEALTDEAKEQILEDFASGTPVARIVANLKVGRRALYAWMAMDVDFAAAWQQAKKYRAESHAEDAHEISEAPAGRLDDGTPARSDADQVNAANLRVKVKQWLAAIVDPKVYGKQPEVQVTIGAMYLTAVQEVNKVDTERRMRVLSEPAAVEGADYEIEIPEPKLEDLL